MKSTAKGQGFSEGPGDGKVGGGAALGAFRFVCPSLHLAGLHKAKQTRNDLCFFCTYLI